MRIRNVLPSEVLKPGDWMRKDFTMSASAASPFKNSRCLTRSFQTMPQLWTLSARTTSAIFDHMPFALACILSVFETFLRFARGKTSLSSSTSSSNSRISRDSGKAWQRSGTCLRDRPQCPLPSLLLRVLIICTALVCGCKTRAKHFVAIPISFNCDREDFSQI